MQTHFNGGNELLHYTESILNIDNELQNLTICHVIPDNKIYETIILKQKF